MIGAHCDGVGQLHRQQGFAWGFRMGISNGDVEFGFRRPLPRHRSDHPRPRDFMIEDALQSTQPELSESTESLFPTEQELDTFARRITLRMYS